MLDVISVAEGIKQLQGPGEHSRTWRIVHAFYEGLKANEPGIRVHQFVRCVEGFVLPEAGKTRRQLVHRTKLFVGPGHESLVGHLFDIRSAVEHLHGPLSTIPGGNDIERGLVLLRRAYEAEVLARYCVHRLFSSLALWPHFRGDAALANFWTLSDTKRQNLWGNTLDFKTAVRIFDEERARLQMDRRVGNKIKE